MIIKKAFILAGGKGDRVKPITLSLPKPLIPINGTPIIKLQIDQLARVGIEEVFILAGYLGEMLESFIKSNSWRIKVTVLQSPTNYTPAQRLLEYINLVDNEFLILYCDNYIESDLEILKIIQSKSELTFLLQARFEGNTMIDSTGRARYFSGERNTLHNYVELGYISIRTNRFKDILITLGDLPRTLELVSQQTDSRGEILVSKLISISNLRRFNKLLKNKKILILDRDGVLLEKMPYRKYLSDISNFRPMYKNWEVLKKLSDTGIYFIVATNQPGIATGEFDEQFLSSIHQRLTSELLNMGIYIIAYYICKHHWDDKCNCRKPKPGMLDNAITDFEIDKTQTIYIGDEEKDRIAAFEAGIKSIILSNLSQRQSDFPDLKEAEHTILKFLNL